MSYDCYHRGSGVEWIWIIIAIIIIICLCSDNNIFGGLFGGNDFCGHDCD